MANSKSRKSLEHRAWQISEPNILSEDQFYVREDRSGIALLAEVQEMI